MIFGRNKINEAVEACRQDPDAVLLDVREEDEFRAGHIPGAVNLPLSRIRSIDLPLDTPLYVYCLRGTRSLQAVGVLKDMDYDDVRSIGGITAYRGPLER